MAGIDDFEERKVQIIHETLRKNTEFLRCRHKWAILDEDRYNFDDIGFMISITSSYIIVIPADCKTVFVDDPENCDLFTSTQCISATRYHVSPMVTFKGVYHIEKHFANDIYLEILYSYSYSCSDSVFLTYVLTLKRLQYFDKYTRAFTKEEIEC